MPGPAQLGILDLIVLLVVVGSVVGAFRRRSGLLSALASGVGAAVLCWLVAGAALAWGPPEVRALASSSYLFDLVPPPAMAMHQLGDLMTQLISHISSTTSKGPQS